MLVVTDLTVADLARLEGVPSAMASARDGIDVLLRDRGLRRTPADATADSLLKGAYASAVLADSVSSWEDVDAGRGDETAQAALRISTELLALVPTLKRSPLQAFARIHALAAVDAPELAGRPAGPEAAQRLQELGRLLLARGDVPALVLAAVAHAEFATGGFFASHNTLVARAVERLVLVATGVDEKSLIVPEAGHLAHRAAYESNLRGWAAGSRNGRHSWLLYAAEAYAAGAEASPLKQG